MKIETSYIADDGKAFTNEKECIEYEKGVPKITVAKFFTVTGRETGVDGDDVCYIVFNPKACSQEVKDTLSYYNRNYGYNGIDYREVASEKCWKVSPMFPGDKSHWRPFSITQFFADAQAIYKILYQLSFSAKDLFNLNNN